MAIAEDQMKDLVFKWADLVIDQTNDLWTISLAFFVAAVLVLAYLHSRPATPANTAPVGIDALGRGRRLVLFAILYLSALATAISLFLSYKVKGSLVSALTDIAQSGAWAVPRHTETNSFLQLVFFSLGIVLFLVAFGTHRRIVGGALVGAVRGG